MKNVIKSIHLSSACCLFLSIMLSSCSVKTKKEINQAAFMNPPASARIYTWWHWMDNAITKEGITRDLEAMKQQGITGATILNISLFGEKDMGVPPVVFGTDQWYDMFKWALQEASRLGITIGAHNCDGWSTSGGPWITPETSMKHYIWSKSYIAGGSPIDTILAKPHGLMDYYEDAAVIAYPASLSPNSFQLVRPMISVNDTIDGSVLVDGNPFSKINIRSDVCIDIKFSQPFVAEQIAIHLRMASSWSSMKDIRVGFTIKASDNGNKYYPVTEFETRGVNENARVDMPKTGSKYFRIKLKRHSEIPDYTPVGLAEIGLLKKGEYPYYSPSYTFHLEKTASTRPEEVGDIFNTKSVSKTSVPVDSAAVIDLSENMGKDGRMQWDAPEGDWTVIRFGYTTTGSMNGPGTNAGRGLECDKMDRAALDLHFRSFPKKLIAAAGNYAGSTFNYLFIDSWECNFQNWTGNFMQAFEKRRGYSLIPWIPVLCGEIENSAEETEAFLHDFRKTIADLIEENYYHHFAELCRQEGLDLHAEVIYGGVHYPPLDILRTNSYVDVPMWEFWTNQDRDGFVHYRPVQDTRFDKPMYAAVLYDKPVVPAEAYTGFAHYSESPWDLKLYGDRAFCSGINRMVLHSYVHQPAERKPGMTLGPFASHFNRHNSWWPQVSEWFTYQTRIQYILQQGQVVSDILYFIGDLLPEFQPETVLYQVPYGYHMQLCNRDILLNHTTMVDGLIKLENGCSFPLLLLPDNQQMEYTTLQRIAALIRDGAAVVGPKPTGVLSLADRDLNTAALEKLAEAVWGKIDGKTVTENSYGQGKIIWGRPLKDILEANDIQPDLKVIKNDSVHLLFIHKKVDERDVYFLVNQEDKQIQTECLFRIADKTPEIWNPQNGTIVKPAVFREEKSGIRMPVCFKPKASLFIIFSDEKPKEHVAAIKQGGMQLFPMIQGAAANVPLPDVILNEDTFAVLSDHPGGYIMIFDTGKEYTVTIEGNEVVEVNNFTGSIAFEGADQKPRPVDISNFQYWTDFTDPAIKYYSGRATYTVQFMLPDTFTTGGDFLELSLGMMKATAAVVLNGHKLGYAWMPGQRFNVSGMLVEGDNTLEITAANVYRNRLIGDLIQFGEIKSVWTTSPVENFLHKDTPLQDAGVVGPVTITKIKKTALK
jgi:hypothetical protein